MLAAVLFMSALTVGMCIFSTNRMVHNFRWNGLCGKLEVPNDKGAKNMEIKLAAQIRALRKARGLTQEQLAEVLGVTVGAVYKWEAGGSLR